MYRISGGSELTAVRRDGSTGHYGRRWTVTSPYRRPSRMFAGGVANSITIVEQADGTYGLLQHQLNWYGREHATFRIAYRAAVAILRGQDTQKTNRTPAQ